MALRPLPQPTRLLPLENGRYDLLNLSSFSSLEFSHIVCSLDDPNKKIQKSYTINKACESWREPEHDKFLEALYLCGIHVSSMDLSMVSFGIHGIPDSSLEHDLLPGSSSCVIPNLAFPPMSILDMDKSLMADIAVSAMDELIKILQSMS